MGAWGIGPFDNDQACDWLIDFHDHGGRKLLEDTLGAALLPGGRASDACRLLAAVEVVAAILGRPCEKFPEDDGPISLSDVSVDGLVALAVSRIPDIVASGLSELWREVGEEEMWLATVADLQRRLASAGR
jgi:hypothetical protein